MAGTQNWQWAWFHRAGFGPLVEKATPPATASTGPPGQNQRPAPRGQPAPNALALQIDAGQSIQSGVEREVSKKVVLIDGPKLADLMIERDVGVIPTKLYKLKDVSNDFFDEDEG